MDVPDTCKTVCSILFHDTETFDTKGSKRSRADTQNTIVMTRMAGSKIGCRWIEQSLNEEIGRLSLYICFKRTGEIVQKSITALIFTAPARLNCNRLKTETARN